MDSDDRLPRLLTRREVLALTGGLGAAMLVGCSGDDDEDQTPTPAAEEPTEQISTTSTAAPTAESLSCVVSPELTEGPFFLDDTLDRSDITSDPTDNSVSEGVPLALTIGVALVDGSGCTPLSGAVVDLWQCDAVGVYSGVVDIAGQFDTTGRLFLRGYQTTNADGLVEFTTIYPGWYQGRTPHLHIKVRSEEQSFEFTSQLFFDDALSDQIFSTLPPYTEKGADRDTTNANDTIFSDQLVLTLNEQGDGYSGRFDVGVTPV